MSASMQPRQPQSHRTHTEMHHCCLAVIAALLLAFLPLSASQGISSRAASNGLNPISYEHPIEPHHSLHIPLDKTSVYWNYGGSTVLTESTIRLTPSVGDRRGWIWNEYPIESKNYEVEFTVEVASKGHFGGEGFCFWMLAGNEDPAFTQRADALDGPVFGMKGDFKGYGVCVDIYDNDNKRNNPSVFVLANPNGETRYWHHDTDFEEDMVTSLPTSLQGVNTDTAHYKCIADIRNTGRSSRFLVKMLHGVMHVYVDTTNSNNFKYCLSVEIPNIDTYKDHHIAFSGATGQVADRHDIREVITRYLSDSDKEFDDSKLSQMKGSGAVHHGKFYTLYWFVINLLSLALAAMVTTQLWNYYTMQQSRIDLVQICHTLNPYVLPHYAAHAAIVVLLLLTGQWRALLINLPAAGFKVYDFVKKSWLFSPSSIGPTKGHATGRVSVYWKLSAQLAFYAIMQLYYGYRLIAS